jgi:hypothetical protein
MPKVLAGPIAVAAKSIAQENFVSFILAVDSRSDRF